MPKPAIHLRILDDITDIQRSGDVKSLVEKTATSLLEHVGGSRCYYYPIHDGRQASVFPAAPGSGLTPDGGQISEKADNCPTPKIPQFCMAGPSGYIKCPACRCGVTSR